MAKKIARLEVDLAANTAKFMKSMNRAANSVKKTSDKIKSSIGQAQLAVGGFFTSQGVGELVRFATTYRLLSGLLPLLPTLQKRPVSRCVSRQI